MSAELQRFEMLARVFREMPSEFAGRPLAPLTAGRWDLLRERNNAFLFGEGAEAVPAAEDYEDEADYESAMQDWAAAAEAEEGELVRGICEFLWVHAAPVREVLAVAGSASEWRRSVQEFMVGSVGMAEMLEFMVGFQAKAQELAAAAVRAVDAEDEEGGGAEDAGKPEQSPTGSPAMSTRSAATKAGSSAGGCSGSSHSRKGSSTPTAPSEKVEKSANGAGTSGAVRMPTWEGETEFAEPGPRSESDGSPSARCPRCESADVVETGPGSYACGSCGLEFTEGGED